MSFLFLLVLSCFLWGCRMNVSGFHEDSMSVDNSTSFRGILAVLVACYHLAQRTGDRSLFHIFVFFGFLPVSYFFFLSGYGLQKSFAAKQNYRKSILRKRIPSVVVPYGFVVFLYWLLSCLEGHPYSLMDVAFSLVNGDPIVTYSWYVLFILLIYFVYYLSTACFTGDNLAIPAVNMLCILTITVVFRRIGMPAHWYSTCITYPLGILWAIKGSKWLPWVKKRYYPVTAVCAVGFAAFFLATMVFSNGKVVLSLYWPCCVLFVITALLIQMKITFRNGLLNILGKCSLEIYLLHGFFMQLYRGENIYIESPLIWCIAVLLSTCLAAIGLNRFFNVALRKNLAWSFRRDPDKATKAVVKK